MRGIQGLQGLQGLQGIQHSFRSRMRQGQTPRRDPAPVLLALDDPGLVDEVSMVVAATGRRIVRADQADDARALVVVTDAPAGKDTARSGHGVRVVRVTGDPVAAQTGGERVLQVPEESPALAAAVGRRDPADIAVAGIVGGAGTSVFAAALAGHLADVTAGGTGQATLVDADPSSAPGHHRLLLGVEGDNGTAGTDGTAGAGETWAGDVLLAERGDREVEARPERPVVRDCGRRDLADLADLADLTDLADRAGCGDVTARILVVPQSVPAVLAARHAVAACPQIRVVLRELPRSGLTWNQTLSLLGRAPEVTWEDDPFLTVDIDRGDFRTTGHGAGTAATAAARLREALQ